MAVNYERRDEFILGFIEKHNEFLNLHCYKVWRQYRNSIHQPEELLSDFYTKVLEMYPDSKIMYREFGFKYFYPFFKNFANDYFRKKKSRQKRNTKYYSGLTQITRIEDDLEKSIEEFTNQFKVTLPPLDADIMSLRCKGYRNKEIGDMLELNENIVAIRIYRAKLKLREILI